MQDTDGKLSKRQLAEVVQSVTKLHALQPMRSASQYDMDAQLRVRRVDRPETCYELLPYFRRLHRWLHVSHPVTAPHSPLNLRRLRTDGSAAVVDEGSGGTDPATGNRRRGGTAEDPRRRREIVAKQRRAAQGQGASKGPTSVSTPVARRRRIQEMSSKPVWEHTPVWEGWLSVRQTYGLRVKYPTLQLAIPVIKINRGVVGAMHVDSSIHVTLSADGTVLSQLWEHNGGPLFSAILALANRGQSIVRRLAPACYTCLNTTPLRAQLPQRLNLKLICLLGFVRVACCCCMFRLNVFECCRSPCCGILLCGWGSRKGRASQEKVTKPSWRHRLLPTRFGYCSVSAAIHPTYPSSRRCTL